MFRYCAMALEADFDEFGYTDASDIEIESEILEIGDDYEAPEPEFRRKLQAEFREFPPKTVPLSHPSVLAADTLPPMPNEIEGLMGLPARSGKPIGISTRSEAKAPPTDSGGRRSKQSQAPFSDVVLGTAKQASEPARKPTTRKATKPERKVSSPVTDPLKKTPAREQIAPLAGARHGTVSSFKAKATPGAKSGKVLSKATQRSTPAEAVTPAKSSTPAKTSGSARVVAARKVATGKNSGKSAPRVATVPSSPDAGKPRRAAVPAGQKAATTKEVSKPGIATKASGTKPAGKASVKRVSHASPPVKKSDSSLAKGTGKAVKRTAKQR